MPKIVMHWKPSTLRAELQYPETHTGRRYLGLLIITIILSVLYLFVQEEYPTIAPLGSLQLLIFEFFILLVFIVDFALRILTIQSKLSDFVFLIIDFMAILPSLIIVLYYLGLIQDAELEFLALLRLFRLARILKLLRMQNVLINIFGASVLTLVFGVMSFHLGLRVFLLEISSAIEFEIIGLLEHQILMVAVPAVGSVFGIALAITFGIAKRKQIEISELHRIALDSLDMFEADIKQIQLDKEWKGTALWRADITRFLNEEITYTMMKSRTMLMLQEVRIATMSRPSLDVPFHNNLVVRISKFLTKTQIEFHPVFYMWLNVIAQLYFLLVLLVAPGVTGILIQMLIIFVFQGLVVIIDDMDHAVDKKVTLLNSKILDV
jgi:hypothetical protein